MIPTFNFFIDKQRYLNDVNYQVFITNKITEVVKQTTDVNYISIRVKNNLTNE